MAGENTTPEPEFIETIIYELNNNMFLAALAGGIVIGAFALFVYLQLQKQKETGDTTLPILHEILPDPPETTETGPRGPDPFGNYQEMGD